MPSRADPRADMAGSALGNPRNIRRVVSAFSAGSWYREPTANGQEKRQKCGQYPHRSSARLPHRLAHLCELEAVVGTAGSTFTVMYGDDPATVLVLILSSHLGSLRIHAPSMKLPSQNFEDASSTTTCCD